MRVLVIHAHPDSESFSHAILAATLDGLARAGHDATVIDLYALDYPGGLSRDEWRAYETNSPVLDPLVAEHVALVRAADALVFVYPTWWSSVPAILKSWLERTMVMGLAFTLDERTRRIQPGLGHLRHLVGISTYGSPRWYVKLINDNGRRTITRTLRLSTGGKARTTWLPLYTLDGRTPDSRRAFLDRVRRSMEKLS
jgi:putative NADPH-quinone reductase